MAGVADGYGDSLYGGSAPYYAAGRLPYPPEIVDALELDGTGRLLDVGCGPGSLTLLLARGFEQAVGIDADAGMVEEARRQALPNTEFRQLRAEELPAGLGTFRMISFAQSFHWLDRERVARTARSMLDADGALLYLHGTTHRSDDDTSGLPYPPPPRAEMDELIRSYLGPVRRAGSTTLPSGHPPEGEEEILRAVGLTLLRRVEVGGGRVFERSEDEIVASAYSLSSAAPHLFGDRLAEFERDLRALLRRTAPDGRFAERQHAVELELWR